MKLIQPPLRAYLVVPVLVLLSGCIWVSQKEIEQKIVGTWACDKGDIARSGITFYPNGKLKSYIVGDPKASRKRFRFSHYNRGRYDVVHNVLVTRVKYYAADPGTKEATALLPKKTVLRKYVVKRIDRQSLFMQKTNDGKIIQNVRCERAYESRLGLYFLNFMRGFKGSQYTEDDDYSPKVAALVHQRKQLDNAVRSINEAHYHRGELGKLLPVIGKAASSDILVSTIIGQHLNYNISGITIVKDAVEQFVARLAESPLFSRVDVAETHSFNIVAEKEVLDKKQKLYEFRISLTLKPPSDDTKSIEPKENTEQAHQRALRQARDRLDALAGKLVARETASTVLKELAKAGAKSGVVFQRFSPLAEQTRHTGVPIIPVKVKLKGSYFQIADFLARFARQAKLTNFYGIQLEPGTQLKQKTLVLSGTINFYFHPETSREFDLRRYADSFPQLHKRYPAVAGLEQGYTDPFNNTTLSHYQGSKTPNRTAQTPPPKDSAQQVHISCQDQQPVSLDRIRYLGMLRRHDGNSALIRTQAGEPKKYREGHCVGRQIELLKITRSKIILKQGIRNRDGSWSTRKVTKNLGGFQ